MTLNKMIKLHINDDRISIYGTNTMDYHWTFVSVMLAICFAGIATSILHMWNLCFIIAIFILGTLKYSIKFTISISKDKFVLTKTFIGIPYLNITQLFNKVLYNEKVPILYFQDQLNRVEVQNFEGFEVDCLLVKAKDKEYEIGNKADALIIFNLIIEGLDKLNVEKIISDIGFENRS
jgi:hypothetical protein